MIVFIFLFIVLIAGAIFLLYLGLNQIALILSVAIICGLYLGLIFLFIECYRVLFVGNAPYVPTRKKLINKILEVIDFKDKAVVYELGCGDAKFLRALVKNKNVRASGYEYFIMPYLLARLYSLFSKKDIKVYYRDFFKVNLSQADYIFCFLIDKEMERLEAKLASELKPGALVISNTFKFKNWEPIKTVALNENKKSSLNNRFFIYRK